MPPVEFRANSTNPIEQLPPLPTKEDRLDGALLVFRKAKEGPLPEGITKIYVSPRDVSRIQGILLAEDLVLKKDYKLSTEQIVALHITPKEIESYISKQEDLALAETNVEVTQEAFPVYHSGVKRPAPRGTKFTRVPYKTEGRARIQDKDGNWYFDDEL